MPNRVVPPVLTTTLLRGTPLVLNRPPARDTVVVTPPPGPVQNPSTPGLEANPSMPPNLSPAQLADWVRGQLLAQERRRADSYWESGHLLALLMAHKEAFGAVDLKTLIEVLQLGVSHFTAQKYMTVAEAFPREVAVEQGIEKCYALTTYAKAIGREGQGLRIWMGDERIQASEETPGGPSTAKVISASKLRRATKRIKEESKQDEIPTAVQLQREKLAKDTAKIARSLGFTKANARLVRHDGQPKIALYIALPDAQNLESKLGPALVKAVGKLTLRQPELLPLLRSAGLSRLRKTG